jgi:UDP-N-acetylmuramoyl-L-alanyl-D-glutamate--2,6-diaminopimelate ligase
VIFGELADKYCDMVILTEDDPRDEDVEDIANQIASGIKNTNYTIVLDRYNAIRQAIDIANINDTILILGKGDEQFMYRVYGREPYIGDHKACIEILEKFYLEEEKEDEKTK